MYTQIIITITIDIKLLPLTVPHNAIAKGLIQLKQSLNSNFFLWN